MRSHPKASSAGSISGLGGSFGSSRPKFLASLCLVLALVAACKASPAFAFETHSYTGVSFGPEGTGAGPNFVEVVSTAVDPSNGNVYAYDRGAEKIYKFDSAGNPVNFSEPGKNVIEGVAAAAFQPDENELAVAPPGSPGGTAGDIYISDGSAVLTFEPSGKQIGELITGGEPCGVATNPSGHLFVGVYPETVKEYVPSASPPKSSDETGASSAELFEICNVAADGLGNVYAAYFAGEPLGVFKLAGLEAASSTQLDPAGSTLAVDPATNDVYADRRSSVAEYDSSGAPVSVFGSGRLSESFGVAVNATSGDVYAGDGKSQRVVVFGPLTTVPDVKAEAPSAVGPRKATLNGTVNPDGIAVSGCEFEYGTSTEYGKTAPCEGAIPTDSADHPVSAALGELKPETTYHFRLAATNANGVNESADQTFKTASAAITGEATAISGAKATLNGTVLPEGEAVSECTFEYGPTTAYGKTVPCEGAIPADEGEHAVTAPIAHLVPNETRYHFRLVIKRPSGTSVGFDKSFETKETVITGGASASNSSTATVEGSVNPEGTLLSECSFEYGPTTSYGQSKACTESPATIGSGSSPVTVHAELSGLSEPAYHYRLVATNVDGTAKGKDRRLGAPLIEDQQAQGVTDSEAELIATINPDGLKTTYHLEYGTTASYGQSTAEAEVGANEVGHVLISELEGLQPDTTYHWRAVATNAHGVSEGIDRTFATFPTFVPETDCPNQPLRTAASAALPDCRAYEMVSPSHKAGEVFAPGGPGGSCNCLPGSTDTHMPMQSSPDGEAVAFEGQPFAEGLASGANEYLARRTASGWGTQSLSPPLFGSSGEVREGYLAFSSDLSRSVVSQREPALSPEAPTKGGKSYANLYLRGEDGSLQPLVTAAPPHREPVFPAFEIIYAGANSGTGQSPAFGHAIFEANDALTAEVPGIAPAAPEIEAGEECSVTVAKQCNLYEWAGGQLRLVNVLPGNAGAVAGARFGSGRVLLKNAGEQAPDVDHAISDDGSHIFWSDRTNGQLYVRIDGVETQKVEDSGQFITASADGSKVLLSDGCLYDLQAKACEDLTAGHSKAHFEGILGGAEDLSRVYFVDTDALTPPGEENANGEHAEATKYNLYAWHEGATTFIGQLLARDGQFRYSTWTASRPSRTAQVSPDGQYLAFMSQASLTGYDNLSRGGDCRGGSQQPGQQPEACNEVFEYNAASGTLICASCNPSGQRPLGSSNLSAINPFQAFPPFPQPGNLSTDGQGRLFFESLDTLSPRDINGHIQDVYEWEPNGIGSCKRAAGCVSLISSGNSPNDSMFVDSSASGNDAFLVTRGQLVLGDKDEQLDLYDARVDGGIEENNTPPCLGEACREAGTSAAEQQSPGSASFSGPGNEKPKHKKHRKRRKHAHRHKSHHRRVAKHNRGGSK